MSGEVQVLHILRKHAGSRRPSSWRQETITCPKEEATQYVSELRSRLAALSGDAMVAKFMEIAKVDSDCGSAKQGGDLGMFGRGAMQKPFEEASFALQVGELSQVVSTDSGEHIILRVR